MTKSPAAGGITTFAITINGNPIPDSMSVFGVEINREINRIPVAKVTVLDGDPSTGTFAASSSDLFLPGAVIVIQGGYDQKNSILFKGIVTSQAIRIDDTAGSLLEVGCHDEAVRMTVGRKSRSFSDMSDAGIFSQLIESYPGLSAEVLENTLRLDSMVQNYVSDWDFLLLRAEANALVVNVLDGKVAVFTPGLDPAPVLSVTYGDDLLEFKARLNALEQLSAVTAESWDYKTQQVISAETHNAYAGAGNLSPDTLSKALGLSDCELHSTASLADNELSSWTKAQLLKSSFSKIQGEVKFQGSALPVPGKFISLQSLGSRFSGDHFISSTRQVFSDGNWITEVSIGLSSDWFSQEIGFMAPPASGLLPAARGLINGTVIKVAQDPDSQYRILVSLPLLDPEGEGVWARLSGFYATSGAGCFFLPEVGDEVVLAFLNEDPRHPVILGSLYSSPTHKPFNSLQAQDNNAIKAIVSRSGINIQFNDESKELSIESPGKNTIILSDKDKQIRIQDENQNSIILSSEGISIKSAKDITIEAGQSVSIQGNTGIRFASPGGDIDAEALNISQSAQMTYSVDGAMSARINSGTELSLKSALIMIN